MNKDERIKARLRVHKDLMEFAIRVGMDPKEASAMACRQVLKMSIKKVQSYIKTLADGQAVTP